MLSQSQPETITTCEDDFAIRLLQHADLAMIYVFGSIGIANSRAFQAELTRLTRDIDTDAVLDLTGLRFINVIGLGVVVGIGKQLKQRGRRLVLHGARPSICRLIRSLRLHELFPPLQRYTPGDTSRPRHELATCA